MLARCDGQRQHAEARRTYGTAASYEEQVFMLTGGPIPHHDQAAQSSAAEARAEADEAGEALERTRLWMTSYVFVGLATAALAVVVGLSAASDEDDDGPSDGNRVGWVAATGAGVLFGGTSVLGKLPELASGRIEPVALQAWVRRRHALATCRRSSVSHQTQHRGLRAWQVCAGIGLLNVVLAAGALLPKLLADGTPEGQAAAGEGLAAELGSSATAGLGAAYALAVVQVLSQTPLQSPSLPASPPPSLSEVRRWAHPCSAAQLIGSISVQASAGPTGPADGGLLAAATSGVGAAGELDARVRGGGAALVGLRDGGGVLLGRPLL